MALTNMASITIIAFVKNIPTFAEGIIYANKAKTKLRIPIIPLTINGLLTNGRFFSGSVSFSFPLDYSILFI